MSRTVTPGQQALARADADDYGTDFLFQGHEGGAGGAGEITRINLDADAEHRVTLLTTTDVNGKPLATIDGSTWDPWAKRLLLMMENPVRRPTRRRRTFLRP